MQLEKDIKITNTPACIEVNFDVLRKALEKDLERFEIVVTSDTVADAKKLATQLNETKKIIDDRRKAEYMMMGTFLSFGLTIAFGLAVRHLLQML